ncbi:MAG: metallophosphoesterase [Myxococcales bacterium]|nr:metallophosphoesterase [Myxococcales bacterium]
MVCRLEPWIKNLGPALLLTLGCTGAIDRAGPTKAAPPEDGGGAAEGMSVEDASERLPDGGGNPTVRPEPPETPPPFTIAALPDTQHYSLSFPLIFAQQTQWIRDHRADEDIVFVLHEGDITHRNTTDEWKAAHGSMQLLDGVIPYAIAIGNHDQGNWSVEQQRIRDSSRFDAYFPVSRFTSSPTFRGTESPTSMINAFHTFEAGGIDWLVVVLEYAPRDKTLEWASNLVRQYPDHQAIILTHDYLAYDGTLHGSDPNHTVLPPSTYTGGANSGIGIWNKFVKDSANVAMVISGHVGHSARRIGTADDGHLVYEIEANYQTLDNGGNGWLRLMRFEPGERALKVRTYSPFLDSFARSDRHEFTFWDFEPLDAVDFSPPVVLSVQREAGSNAATVVFNETLDPTTASDAANFQILGTTVESVTLRPDGRIVDVAFAPLPDGKAPVLALRDIADNAGRHNRLEGPVAFSVEEIQPVIE